MELKGDDLSSFLSAYGRVEEMTPLRSNSGTSYEDYELGICLDRENFKAITDAIKIRDRQMMGVVECRKLHCLHCNQIGHLAKSCAQKTGNGPTEG